MFKKLFKMFILYNENKTTTIFEDKIDMLKKIFFSISFNSDFSNIKNSTYSFEINCSLIIVEEKITKTINRQHFDKASGFDDIFNKILKTVTKPLAKGLFFLF